MLAAQSHTHTQRHTRIQWNQWCEQDTHPFSANQKRREYRPLQLHTLAFGLAALMHVCANCCTLYRCNNMVCVSVCLNVEIKPNAFRMRICRYTILSTRINKPRKVVLNYSFIGYDWLSKIFNNSYANKWTMEDCELPIAHAHRKWIP